MVGRASGDGRNLRLIEPAQPGQAQRHALLGLRFRFHQRIGERIAFELTQRHGAQAFVGASLAIGGACNHQVDLTEPFPADNGDTDTVQASNMVKTSWVIVTFDTDGEV